MEAINEVVMDPDAFFVLPPELQQQIALDLDRESLLNLCAASKRLKRNICEDEYFWKIKYKKDHDLIEKVKRDLTWKENYFILPGLPIRSDRLNLGPGFARRVQIPMQPRIIHPDDIERWKKQIFYARGKIYHREILPYKGKNLGCVGEAPFIGLRRDGLPICWTSRS